MPLQGANICIGTQTMSGSTMINLHWHAKIDAQQFYFMVLPVGRNLIDLAVSLTGMHELYTDAHGDKYDECSLKNHERTCHAEVGPIGSNIKLQMLLLRWEMIVKNKNKRKLSALVSSRSLDERTTVESQSNGLYLTSWGWHHNIVLCSQNWIRGTQCHQGALWRYGFLSACSHWVYKISINANIHGE